MIQLFSQPPGTTSALQRNPLQQMELSRLRERARTLARLEGFYVTDRVVTMNGEPAAVQSAAVTPGLFPMMAVPVVEGRLTPSEGEPGHFVAVVSHRYWRDVLGSKKAAGASLIIDGQPHVVIGVMASDFNVPFIDAQIFTPLVASPEPKTRAPALTVMGVAELAPGASLELARVELTSISAQLASEFPKSHAHWVLGAQDVREWQYGSLRAPLLMLLAAAGCVLLIACVNIANLSSAQAVARSGELALRVALGASKADLLRVHLAELLIVAISGLIPGLLLAAAAVPALLAIHPAVAKTLGVVTVDWRVQAFSIAAAVLTAIFGSIVPVARAMRGAGPGFLTASSIRTTASLRAVRLRRALVSVEVAL